MTFDLGFNSPYFKMLDDILNSDIPFLSRYHTDDIKSVKKPTKVLNEVAKLFCILTEIKPERKGAPDGQVDVNYFNAFMKFVKNGKLAGI